MNIHNDNEEFRTPEQPHFLSNKMMAEESLLEFEDLEKLLNAMKITGEINNPWYNDWFNSLNNIPKKEWFRELDLILFMAKEESFRNLDQNEREIKRFEERRIRDSTLDNNKRESISYLNEAKKIEVDKIKKEHKVALYCHYLAKIMNPIANAFLIVVAALLLYSLIK